MFDPSTGQPSSTSDESEEPVETPLYEPSQSSNNTSSRKVYTPQSASDAPSDLHHCAMSVESSNGESHDSGADQPRPLSVSARASFDASEIRPSSNSIQMPKGSPTVESPASTMMSPAVDLPIPDRFDPLQGMSPRSIIDLEPNDIKCLEVIMSSDDQCRPIADEQSADLPLSNIAQGSQLDYEETPQRTGTHKTKVVMRTPRGSRPRSNPMEPRLSTKDGKDKAKAIDKVKMMRKIGVCLPCLVNHEPVSDRQN